MKCILDVTSSDSRKFHDSKAFIQELDFAFHDLVYSSREAAFTLLRSLKLHKGYLHVTHVGVVARLRV